MKFPPVIFEDNFIFLIAKPAELPVYPRSILNPDLTDTNNLACLIDEKYPALRDCGGKNQRGILHRLDNETSGLLLCAKTDRAYKFIKDNWTDKTTKTYEALCLGKVEKAVIKKPIAHKPSSKKKMMVCETATKAKANKAREATTFINGSRALKNPSDDSVYSLTEISIETGVRHQIRVHLASLGHPLAGDGLYQNAENKNKDTLGLTSFLLHLKKLEFIHPETKKKMVFDCDWPEKAKEIFKKLRPIKA